MIVFLLLIVVLLIGLTAAAVMGRIGGSMAEPTSSHAFSGVPDGPLSTWLDRDIGELRFDQALRGYRMDQVDEVVDALSARLRALETELGTELETKAASWRSTGVPDSAGSDPQEQ